MEDITVIIPTIKGREALLEACVTAYEDTCPGCEIIVIPNEKNCGRAWNKGLEKVTTKYTHITADDIIPKDKWWATAVTYTTIGVAVSPLILWPDLSIQSCGSTWGGIEPDGATTGITRIPFLLWKWIPLVYPIIDKHYTTDVDLSDKLLSHNIPIINSHQYLFIHSMSEIGRLCASS